MAAQVIRAAAIAGTKQEVGVAVLERFEVRRGIQRNRCRGAADRRRDVDRPTCTSSKSQRSDRLELLPLDDADDSLLTGRRVMTARRAVIRSKCASPDSSASEDQSSATS